MSIISKAAHNAYLKKFYPAGKNYGQFETFAAKAQSINEYYVQSKIYIDSLISIWDSLKNGKLISNDVYALYLADTRAALYDESILKLTKANKHDSGLNFYLKKELTKNVMFYHGNASDCLLLKTFAGHYLHDSYLKNILGDDAVIKDTLLKKAEFGFYYYYDTTYRELAWGSSLYYLKTFFPSLDVSAGNVDIGAFKKFYPNSRFLQKIYQFQDSLLKKRRKINISLTLDTVNYKSLKELLSTINTNYIFIDIWATWCVPCIQEFIYLPSTDLFLKGKDINQAYLSIDKMNDKGKWERFVRDNYIPGYHFIISEKVQDEVLKILAEKTGETSLFIPRYLLYDKKSDKFYIDLPRPSTGVVLESAVNDILNN